jgi:hypothetical protein
MENLMPRMNIKSQRKKAKKSELCLLILDLKKGEAIPLQAWTGPEVSRRLRLPDVQTIGI